MASYGFQYASSMPITWVTDALQMVPHPSDRVPRPSHYHYPRKTCPTKDRQEDNPWPDNRKIQRKFCIFLMFLLSKWK